MKKKQTQKHMSDDKIKLELYVSGMSVKSMQAIENIKKICEEHLKDSFELEIIDLYKNPTAAADYNIIFSPSLIKRSPLPLKIIIGNFSDSEKVIKALGINIKK